MFKARRLATIFAVALLTLTAVGCTDNPASGPGGTNNGRVDDPVDAPDNGQLLHVDPCTPGQANCVIDMTLSTEREIKVQLVDANGDPVSNAQVNFDGNFGGTELALSTTSAYTDGDGIAKATINAGTVIGTGTVSASTTNEAIEPVKWTIGVSSKGSASYRVSFDHSGAAEIKNIDVRLFPDNVSCDDLTANPNQTAVLERAGLVDASGAFPTVIFPDRPNGDAYTVAAWGKSLNNSDVEVAYGCKDGNPPVTDGRPVDVTVTMVDHIPNIVGTYQVTHQFNLEDTLPQNVRTIVDLIGRLATDPGSFVVGCPASSSDPDCPSGTQGIIQLLVNFLPNSSFKDAINSFLQSNIGNAAVRDAINSVAQNWLDNSAPAWASSAVNISSDILQTLRHFEVQGVIRITQPPQISIDQTTGDVVGILPADSGEQSWNNYIFTWSQGCENATDPAQCARREFGARQLGLSAVHGTFDGTIFGSDELQINQHTLSLNYGALLIAIIEKLVLPQVFGNHCGTSGNQPCDSLEGALKQMISCQDMSQYIVDHVGGGSNVQQIATNLCNDLLDQAAQKLRDYATTNLVADGSDVFLIGTPDGENCKIMQPDVYQGDWQGKPLPYIEYLGKDDPANLQCKWDVKIRFSSSYTAHVNGKFWGKRSSF